jgi:hypothetical protein
MKIDSTWNIDVYKKYETDSVRFINWPASYVYMDYDSGKNFSWFVTASKDYPSVSEMSESFRFDNSGFDSIRPVIQFNKKFRWFYTWYEFSEVYPATNPFTIVPISDYMSDSQVAALYGEDRELYRGKNGFEILSELKDLNDKSDKWMEHNLYEEIFRQFTENYERFPDAPVSLDEFKMEKDTIYKYYIKTDSSDFSDLEAVFNHHFHTEAFTVDEEFDSMLEKALGKLIWTDDLELNYMLALPGKITETNAPFVNNDTLSWKVNNERFYFTNYELKATSREPNEWAFVITGAIVLLALSTFFIRKKTV